MIQQDLELNNLHNKVFRLTSHRQAILLRGTINDLINHMLARGISTQEIHQCLDENEAKLNAAFDALGMAPGKRRYVPRHHPSGLGGQLIYRPKYQPVQNP